LTSALIGSIIKTDEETTDGNLSVVKMWPKSHRLA